MNILSITAPIYIIVLLGYLLTRFGLFEKSEMRTFGKFVVNVALPALIFKSFSERQISEILNITYVCAYAVGTLMVIVTGLWWYRRIARIDTQASALYTMGMACSNSAFVGFPILLLTLPSVAATAFAMNMIVENLLIIPILLLLAEKTLGGPSMWIIYRKTLVRLATNPLIIALLACFVTSMIQLRLPPLLVQTVNLLAMASGALSLFVIGGTLVGLSIKTIGNSVIPIVLGKLIFHPLWVFLAIILLPILGLPVLDPMLRMAIILTAAMPVMGIYVTLAQQYGKEDVCAVAQLTITFVSFFTLSGIIWLLSQV